MIYLMADEKRNGTNFKVGYTRNIDNRMTYYITHNPNARLLQTIITYKKTKMELEKEIHAELKAMGIEFLKGMDGTTTEWFFIPADKEAEWLEKGFEMFKSTKGRKIARY